MKAEFKKIRSATDYEDLKKTVTLLEDKVRKN